MGTGTSRACFDKTPLRSHGSVSDGKTKAFLDTCDLGWLLNNGFTGEGTPEFHFRSEKRKEQGAKVIIVDDGHCGRNAAREPCF